MLPGRRIMRLGYDIGDEVIQVDDMIVGRVIKLYKPTACKQQTMILCNNGRRYHAPSESFIKLNELKKEIVSKVKTRPPKLATSNAMSLVQDATQPLLVQHNYRNVKIAEEMTITIDIEELKSKLIESHYEKIDLYMNR